MNAPAANCGQDGFTLLETIIAFLILSISLAVAVQTISQGALAFRRSADLQQASLVMEMLAGGEIRSLASPGEISGKINSASWRMTATAIGDRYPGNIFVVEVQIRPRGEDGPVFDYSTIAVSGGAE